MIRLDHLKTALKVLFWVQKRNWEITLKVDRDSDGTIDETVDLDNQMQFIFLPVVGLH